MSLGSEVKEKGIWPSLGAMLTISQGNIFGPSTLCITAGKGKEDFFNSLSLILSFPSISSSSLSVWSLSYYSFAVLLVRSFHNSGSDCSVKFSQSLPIAIFPYNGFIFVNFSTSLLTKAGQICCLLTVLLLVNQRFKAREIKYSS